MVKIAVPMVVPIDLMRLTDDVVIPISVGLELFWNLQDHVGVDGHAREVEQSQEAEYGSDDEPGLVSGPLDEGPGGDGCDHHSGDHGQRPYSGFERGQSEDSHGEHVREHHGTDHSDSEDRHEDGRHDDCLVVYQMGCEDGVDGLVLDLHEHDDEDDGDDDHGSRLDARPLELLSSELDQEQDVQKQQREEGDSLDIDVLLTVVDRCGELLDGEDERDDRERDVNVEAPVPAYGTLDVPSDEGSDSASDTEYGTEDTLHPGPLTGGVQVRDGSRGDGDQDTTADSLDGTADDEHLHVGGQTGAHGADSEEPETDEEQGLPAVDIRKLSRDGNHDRLAEEVRRGHPGVQAETAQVLRQFGSDGTDDRTVETRPEHSDAQTNHDGVAHLRVDVLVCDLFGCYRNPSQDS